MSGWRLPPPWGAWIDRTRASRLQFNGSQVPAFAGDTVASALLAHGTVHVGRSFKYHRPRGVFSAGVEEPSGLLDIGDGNQRTPNTRATEALAADGLVARTGNAWPSLRFDLAALNSRFSALMPAGFYYKTFIWPHWHLFEPTIRRAAGLGHAADGADPDRYDEVSREVDVLVVGAGAAGLAAATAAAQAGRQVLLLEGAAHPGGWLAAQWPAGQADPLLRQAQAAGVELHTRCTVFGLYDHGMAAAVRTLDGPAREQLLKIRARRTVLACGAFERPMLFADNDRPGVMLASAVERYASLYGVACGRRVIIAAACDSAYGVAHTLRAAGVAVAAIVEHRDSSPAQAPAGVPVFPAHNIVAVAGGRAVRGVTIAAHDGSGVQTLDADIVASAGGWTPAVNLFSMAGGKLAWDDTAAMFVPAGPRPGIACVGACAGAFGFDAAIEHAQAIGRGADGPAPVGDLGPVPADNTAPKAAQAALGRRAGKVFIDLQNDVTEADVALAARENYRSVEHLKRYTTMGMATDQGKTSNINALVQMARHTRRTPPQVGTTKFRPPFIPVTLNAIAAGRQGERCKPLRRMPAHDFHLARGASMEEFGGWLRPAAYPRSGESLDQAAQREAAHTRRSVCLFEGSPLGKIEVFGPDAADFLDLMYVGTMSTLPLGGARYGLLLNETGVVIDDGIVARLGPEHFWVNTTSGGAERMALAFEEWLQCEYVKHRVFVQPVVSQWGNVTVAGPQAWTLLQAAGFDTSLAPAAMKHMTMRELPYAGTTVRVMRASFSGELGYEINLPALSTQALIERLWSVGQALEVGVYGIEALDLMRLEKGFIHIGADTDGTTMPQDIGFGKAIAKKAANFVGRRSLLQPAGQDLQRMQLVGLQPVDRRTRLPVGAHIAASAPPCEVDGFVTSSGFSPALQQPIALAMLRSGGQRLGERLRVFHLGHEVAAEVVKTPFFDATGDRLNG